MQRDKSTPKGETTSVTFDMGSLERYYLQDLPWHVPLEEWPENGIVPLNIRRGESRHPVIFVERSGGRYAIKETTPRMALREISSLREIERRGIPSLQPIGSVVVKEKPIALGISGPGGLEQYINSDRGYTVTRLSPRVVPHVLLFRLPFNRRNKQRLLSAIAVLMVELHEHGVYWGDPSLANILIRVDGKRILAIMADAETTEIFDGPISEGLRQQDMELFSESLAWQSEDLREARGLPESDELLSQDDYRYFTQRYRWIRREHLLLTESTRTDTLIRAQHLLSNLNKWGFSLLSISGHTLQSIATVSPGWYHQRIKELLGISMPRKHARRFYNLILGHQALMSERARRNISIEEAAHDWYHNYHLPTILLLRQNLTHEQDPMQAYFAIMQHKWDMSVKAGHEIHLDDAVLSWSMDHAEEGNLGEVDPADVATYWHQRESVANALEPPLIESEKLEPLLSDSQKSLVHLPPQELDSELTGILENTRPDTGEEKEKE